VVVVMAVMMVLGRGKRRSGNHHNEQGGEQRFLHGCIVALVLLRKHTTFGEERDKAYQGSEQGTVDDREGAID
jgi:hypothetical protein